MINVTINSTKENASFFIFLTMFFIICFYFFILCYRWIGFSVTTGLLRRTITPRNDVGVDLRGLGSNRFQRDTMPATETIFRTPNRAKRLIFILFFSYFAF